MAGLEMRDRNRPGTEHKVAGQRLELSLDLGRIRPSDMWIPIEPIRSSLQLRLDLACPRERMNAGARGPIRSTVIPASSRQLEM